MKKIFLFLLLTSVVATFATEKIAIDFKSQMKNLTNIQKSNDVFVAKAPALAIDGQGKKNFVVSHHFYAFRNDAKALAGKKLLLRAKIKRINGIAPLSFGYRVFGNGNKLMESRYISTPAKKTDKWEDIEMSFQVSKRDGIENVNVGFVLNQKTSENNRIIIDDVKICMVEK